MFIAFEGGDASGKSTQAERLAHRLDAVLTREPGSTWLGEHLRALLLDPDGQVDGRAEALLMAAARAQHVAEVIRPALAAGRTVVTDRFSGSSLAYQGVARGLGIDAVASLSAFATDGLEPDVVVLLDVPLDEAARRRDGESPDRIEAGGDRFHRLVREGYLQLAAADARWVVIDGRDDPDDVEAAVWAAVAGMLRQ